MIDYSSIIKSRLLSRIDEKDGDFIKNALKEYKSVKKDGIDSFLNREQKSLEYIRRKKYDKAVKFISDNKINPFSLFNNIEIFDNRYDNIPFIAAAFGLLSEKTTNVEKMIESITSSISEVFVPSGINSANMFDAKFTSKTGISDIFYFVFTHDGQIKPKKYSQDTDLSVLTFLNWLLNYNYTLNNINGLIKYVIENDLISSLKFLISNGIYSPNSEDFHRFNINRKSNVGRLLSVISTHEFKFHEPEVEYDDKGKFSGGNIYLPLKNVGYDISKDKEQKVHISIAWMIRDAIASAYFNYKNNGENFSNETDINLYDGSEFEDATEKLKYMCSEYHKYINLNHSLNVEEKDKEQFLRNVIKSVNANVLRLEHGLNEVLKKIDFPMVELTTNSKIDEKDRNIKYNAVNFMKEIWNSVKIAK